MKESLARKLAELDEHIELYEGYSGRGMFGETTWAITEVSPIQLCELLLKNIDELYDTIKPSEVGQLRCDSYGKSYIIY